MQFEYHFGMNVADDASPAKDAANNNHNSAKQTPISNGVASPTEQQAVPADQVESWSETGSADILF